MYLKQTNKYENQNTQNIPDAKYPERKAQPKNNASFLTKGIIGGTGLGFGLKAINDLNDKPDNLQHFGHVGKLFHIGENDSGGFSVASSSGPMPAIGGGSILLKDKSPLDFKDKLKNLKSRRTGSYNTKSPL